jgi:hypothetical protein
MPLAADRPSILDLAFDSTDEAIPLRREPQCPAPPPYLTARDQFAIHAPADVHPLFAHVPAPGRPAPLPTQEGVFGPRPAEAAAGETFDQFHARRAAWSAAVNAWWSSAEQTKLRHEHDDATVRWKLADAIARATQWRYAWADAMLAAREAR